MLPISLNCTIFNVIIHKKKKEKLHLVIHSLFAIILFPDNYGILAFPSWLNSKKPIFKAEHRICRLNPWVRKIPWRRV